MAERTYRLGVLPRHIPFKSTYIKREIRLGRLKAIRVAPRVRVVTETELRRYQREILGILTDDTAE